MSWSLRAGSLRAGWFSALLAFAFVAAACSAESTAESDSSAGSETAETSGFLDLTVATSDGGQLDWGSLEGRDVVLWFWAPW